MPNYVRTRITFANGWEEFKRRCLDGKSQFDFNKVVPMPDSIKNTTSGTRNAQDLTAYLACFDPDYPEIRHGGYRKATSKLFERMLFNASGGTNLYFYPRGDQKAIHSAYDEGDFESGKKLYANIITYGSATWYEWSRWNWGTKWNAETVCIDDDAKSVTIDTPWSAPSGVLMALAKMMPKAEAIAMYADEDIGSNVGYYHIAYGSCVLVEVCEDLSRSALRIANDLWECEVK